MAGTLCCRHSLGRCTMGTAGGLSAGHGSARTRRPGHAPGRIEPRLAVHGGDPRWLWGAAFTPGALEPPLRDASGEPEGPLGKSCDLGLDRAVRVSREEKSWGAWEGGSERTATPPRWDCSGLSPATGLEPVLLAHSLAAQTQDGSEQAGGKPGSGSRPRCPGVQQWGAREQVHERASQQHGGRWGCGA